VYLPSAFCVVKAEPEVSFFCDGFIWWWLSPQGCNPNTENSTWWKAGGLHYKITISRLGSQGPCGNAWAYVSQYQTPNVVL
jgi:hypothetical protein